MNKDIDKIKVLEELLFELKYKEVGTSGYSRPIEHTRKDIEGVVSGVDPILLEKLQARGRGISSSTEPRVSYTAYTVDELVSVINGFEFKSGEDLKRVLEAIRFKETVPVTDPIIRLNLEKIDDIIFIETHNGPESLTKDEALRLSDYLRRFARGIEVEREISIGDVYSIDKVMSCSELDSDRRDDRYQFDKGALIVVGTSLVPEVVEIKLLHNKRFFKDSIFAACRSSIKECCTFQFTLDIKAMQEEITDEN